MLSAFELAVASCQLWDPSGENLPPKGWYNAFSNERTMISASNI